MYLTKEEKEMLDGKRGFPVQKAMEILVGLGECYDAEKMIPVSSAHLLTFACGTGKAWNLFVKELAAKGGKFAIFADTNPISIDRSAWREMGISEKDANEQLALDKAMVQMGAYLCHTCSHYLIGNTPRKGEHVAWSESSAVVFANSALGARTNREGAPSSIAAALTGRVPAYGYHLDENRQGQMKVVVTAKMNDLTDYGTLGYFVGKIAEDKVPVLVGMSPRITSNELKIMGAAMSTSGSTALYHAVGITPEAPTEEAAFGGRNAKDSLTVEFGEKELRETEALLDKAPGKVDMVMFGCPHASISEIGDIASRLSGKKVREGVDVWILASIMMKKYAEAMGYLDTIEAAGARIICDSCPSNWPPDTLKKRGRTKAATNSAKLTYYIEGGQDVLSHYGSTERCITAALTGEWR